MSLTGAGRVRTSGGIVVAGAWGDEPAPPAAAPAFDPADHETDDEASLTAGDESGAQRQEAGA